MNWWYVKVFFIFGSVLLFCIIFLRDDHTGEHITYYEDGKIEERGYYVDGYKDGMWTRYRKYGNIFSEGNYVLGKRQGIWVFNDLSGKKDREETYADGKRNGRCIFFHEKGNKVLEGDYKDDMKEGKWIGYDWSGEIKFEGNYREGKKEGKWIHYRRYYKEERKIVKIEIYKRGKVIKEMDCHRNPEDCNEEKLLIY
jgi:antitoxin component YwqK of YwqJK toxin-antitoxin module